MHGNSESVLIEILDADPTAFGTGGSAEPPPARPTPWWRRPAGTALVALVALVTATVAVVIWQPWHHEPTPPLSNRLVLDLPTSSVLDVGIDRLRPATVSADVGYVYAEDGATLPWLGTGSGRWLGWSAYPVDSPNTAYSDFPDGGRRVDDVQSATAAVWGDDDALRLVFGPIGGRIFDVGSSGLTLDEVTSVAGAIGVTNGRPTLGGGHDALFDLLGLRPLGTYEELSAAVSLVLGGTRPPTSIATTAIGFTDGQGGVARIASVADTGDGPLMGMVRALLGPAGTATVHHRDALATSVQAVFSSDSTPDNLVAWHEGGRLIVVTGSASLAAIVAIADGAHEATEDQWAPIAAQADPDQDRYLYTQSTIGYRLGADHAVMEISASMDRPGSITVCLQDEFAGVEECARDPEMRLPYLHLAQIHSASILIAMVAARSEGDGSGEALLRLHHADGSVADHLLFAPGLRLPGPAVAVPLPDDLREAELVVDGKVVATL